MRGLMIGTLFCFITVHSTGYTHGYSAGDEVIAVKWYSNNPFVRRSSQKFAPEAEAKGNGLPFAGRIDHCDKTYAWIWWKKATGRNMYAAPLKTRFTSKRFIKKPLLTPPLHSQEQPRQSNPISGTTAPSSVQPKKSWWERIGETGPLDANNFVIYGDGSVHSRNNLPAQPFLEHLKHVKDTNGFLAAQALIEENVAEDARAFQHSKDTGSLREALLNRKLAVRRLAEEFTGSSGTSNAITPILLLCAFLACLFGRWLRRRFLQAKKRRDSFGFPPDSRRNSLKACEELTIVVSPHNRESIASMRSGVT